MFPLTTEPVDIDIESATNTTIRVAVKKTKRKIPGFQGPIIDYELNGAAGINCPLSPLNKTHDLCTISSLVPAKQQRVRFQARYYVYGSFFDNNWSRIHTVWTIPNGTSRVFFLCAKYSAFASSCPLPTDTFFFQIFTDAMFNSLQTSFNNIMKDWPDKRHAWVTPSTRDGTYYKHTMYMCCYRIPVVYINMPYHILFKGTHFVLSY